MNDLTFAIIKPDAVRNNYTGKIYDRILNAGFEIIAAKLKKMSKSEGLMNFTQFILISHFIMI